MATREQIPTDLTLEIGEAVSPERFMALARAFFGYIEEITESVSNDPAPVKWNVLVREGSNLIAVEPLAGAPIEVLQRVYAKAEFGIRQLSRGLLEESQLTEPALKHLRALSEGTEPHRGHATLIRVWVRKEPVHLTPEIARVIEDDWRVGFHDYGTVEGRLETIQDNDGRLQFRIRDAAVRQTVRCSVPDKMLDEIFASFRKRIEVTGMIHYRRNGVPVSIDVAHLEVLPDDSELPTADDVRGILKVEDGGRTDILG